MKILATSQSKQGIGGGWTFLRTFAKYAPKYGGQIVSSGDADVLLISGATMLQRDFVFEWKKKGMKIVLRVDNIPRNSRNRNTGTSRLKDFAAAADLVIYQSEWARDYIQPFLQKDGVVILNGADPEIFNTSGSIRPRDGEPQHLFVQYNRDETKQWHQMWFEYQMRFRELTEEGKRPHLWIAGQFSPELQAANFDFFMGERFEYLGVLEEPEEMAEVMRGADVLLAPYYNDACSQTIVEARMCGVGVIEHNATGGTAEIIKAPIQCLSAEYMAERYMSEIARLL